MAILRRLSSVLGSVFSVSGVGWALLYRLLVMFSGVALILVLPFTTTPEEQGAYYALLGLVSLYVVADLGLSSALINFVSHQIDPDRPHDSEPVKAANLSRLMRFSASWALFGSIVLGLVVYLFGRTLLQREFEVFPSLHEALLLVCVVTVFTFQLFTAFAILEGLNRVAEAFFIRSIYISVLIVTQLVFLLAGYAYFALVIGQLLALLSAAILFLSRNMSSFIQLAGVPPQKADLSIREKVIPFQLRLAITWIFGFLPIQLMPTLLFASLGSVWAGKIGMTQQIVTAISATAFIFVQVIVPRIGQLVASEQSSEVQALYKNALKRSLMVSILAVFCVVAAQIVLSVKAADISARILPLELLIPFLCLVLINWITFARAALARAYHEEVMLWPTIVGGLAAFSVLITAGSLETNLLVYGLVGSAAFASLVLGGVFFRAFAKQKGLIG